MTALPHGVAGLREPAGSETPLWMPRRQLDRLTWERGATHSFPHVLRVIDAMTPVVARARAVAAVAVLALTGVGPSDWMCVADEPAATDLLKRADATIVCAAPARAIDSPAAFGDGDPATAAEIPARPDQDIDLLVSWGGATATIQRIVIALDPDRPEPSLGPHWHHSGLKPEARSRSAQPA